MRYRSSFSRVLKVLVVLTVLCLFSAFVNAEDSTQTPSEPIVSISFFDSDIREALKELAIQANVNIIVGEGVYGVVTLDAPEVPISTALKMILIGGGYAYKKIDDFYFVGTPDPKSKNFTILSETQVYKTKHVDTDVIQSSLPSIHAPYVKYSKEQSMVIITAPQSIIDVILADIHKIDIPKQQVRIKSLVTEVSSSDAKALGVNLLEWMKGSGESSNGFSASYSDGSFTVAFDGFDQLLSKVQLLAVNNKATIHADPVVMVTEGKAAELFTGKRVTISTSNSTSTSTEKIEVGTSLSVIPKIIGDNIELTVIQKISDIDSSEYANVASTARELSSTVVVAPGQTVLIGSISQKRTTNAKSKVPILGDIPLLNLLFSKVNKQVADSELMVFISAEVVNK